MHEYTEIDLAEAHQLVEGLTSKAYERIAAALAARQRKGADREADSAEHGRARDEAQEQVRHG